MLSLSFMLLFSAYISAVHGTVENEELAICSLVAATNVESLLSDWSCNTDGSTTSHPCPHTGPWVGIACNGVYGDVTTIDLPNVGFAGTIPTGLVTHTMFTRITLAGNSLTCMLF